MGPMQIAYVSDKGGCGKSLLCCLCALWWAEQGKRVGLRDLDRQGSTGAFLAHLGHPGLTDQTKGADYVLCDTPGGMADRDLRNVVQWADLVLIPMQLSGSDFRATAATIRRIPESQKARLIFNRYKTASGVAQDRQRYADELGYSALEHGLADRLAYPQALLDGWSALHKTARDELGALVGEIETYGQG